MKVWITKYALTDGIIEVEGEQDRLTYGFVATEGAFRNEWFNRRDCFTSRTSAIKKAEEMRQKKIESLKKKIDKLERIRFE